MRLITAHRVLIGAAIAFFLYYAAWQFRLWLAAGAAGALVQAVVAAGVTLGLCVYYRSLRRWGQRP